MSDTGIEERLVWSRDDVEVIDTNGQPLVALTAAADVADGAMVALVPADADLDHLVLDHADAEPRDQLHLTLAYLGSAADWSPNQRDGLIGRLKMLVEDAVRPDTDAPDGIVAQAFGVNYWNPRATGDQESSWNLAVGGSELGWIHALVWSCIEECRGEVPLPVIPEQHEPWVPHICLAYSTDLDLIDQVIRRVGPITFDRLRVAFGGANADVPLGQPSTSTQPEATMSRTARLWHGAG